MTKAQTVQNHGLDRLSDGNHPLFVILHDDRIDEFDDAQFIHHRRNQTQVVQIVALIGDRSAHRARLNMDSHCFLLDYVHIYHYSNIIPLFAVRGCGMSAMRGSQSLQGGGLNGYERYSVSLRFVDYIFSNRIT